MAKSKLKYPKLIYVGVEYDRDTSYFVAYADPTEAADLTDALENRVRLTPST